ncbi:MAG: hypothetical protein O6945_04960 [Gammaproteobacteria bacterium]|nr:hypothetical protein [Gammaproteobacteria bacterium]
MNNQQRQELKQIRDDLVACLVNAGARLDEMRQDEETKFESLTEGLQAAPMGEQLECAAEALQNCQISIEEFKEEFTSEIEEALA